MRSIWTGSIGFGLINIPIKMYSAIRQSELDLDMLDKKDHANIKYQRVNANTGKEVAWENIVRGYKVDDRYVVLSDKDFERASPEKTKIVEIIEFVDEKDIESIYYESFYYLEPDKSGAKAYALLRDALKETGKVGLGSYVLRNRESLAIIKVFSNTLILNKLRFHQEIRPIDITLPKTKSTASELKMAQLLISHLSGKFDISKYNDTYSQKLLKLIHAKAKGKSVPSKPVRTPSRTKDLMSQLRASLQSSKSPNRNSARTSARSSMGHSARRHLN